MVSVMGNGAFAGSVGGEVRSWETSGIADTITIGAEAVEETDATGRDSVGAGISCWIEAFFWHFCFEDAIGDRGHLR